MSKRIWVAALVALVLVGAGAAALVLLKGQRCPDGEARTEPKIVDPGDAGGPPSDAIVLFDGRDLLEWENGENWPVRNGVATVGVGKGGITTRRAFGDCQLHIEWATPPVVSGSGQERGNSGIYLQERYEIQVLDSYQNSTYPDGQAAAIYSQWPPLVNASRKPGEWQTFDIVFEAPRFDGAGKLTRPAYITLLHNGLVVHNHREILGPTSWSLSPGYKPHPPRQKLHIQDHGCPVRYRNIWIREL
ncbi:MAG: DUF1080 domain-containing protein [Acidobacteria bacterium]|nr:DUF1080 domain-containing protein [Acidobacteriota bacterium]